MPREQVKFVVYAAHEDPAPSKYVADQTGIPLIKLPYTIGGTPDATDFPSFYRSTVEREGLARLETQARLATIDRAARSFYLLEGRYPASLEDLIARSLLAPSQRSLPDGDHLVMEPAADAYRLAIAGDPDAAGFTESVAGDVLLDRALFAGVQDETGVPLVLLD